MQFLRLAKNDGIIERERLKPAFLLILFMSVVRMESLKLFQVIVSTFPKWHIVVGHMGN